MLECSTNIAIIQIEVSSQRAVVIINDPCHNPTGYTMTKQEWKQILDGFNQLSEKGKIVLLHDVAYIDFNHQLDDWKDHF